MEIFEVDNLDVCRDIWQAVVPQESLFDLWEVRECFWRYYGGQPLFLVARRGEDICGLLALTRTESFDSWGCFPGETWMGKTWLERNRIVASDREVCSELLKRCPPNTHLRYLSSENLSEGLLSVDEIGYLFIPEQWGYSVDNYWSAFSGKSRKRLRQEMDGLLSRGAEIRRGVMEDAEMLFELNLKSFGQSSYFADDRFCSGFRDLISILAERGDLGVTTLLIEGQIAAVDVSAICQNACTILAGGTHPDFPGVAKVINLAHIEWACEQRYAEVDFLCGDFGWKQRFHLTPRPLYQYRSPARDLNSEMLEPAGYVHAE